jgi:GDP-4-dehydro-6-deoxy-D-mannose reductase
LKILITGGTGFIGHYLAAHEVGRGHEVLCTRYEGGQLPLLPEVRGAMYQHLDITEKKSVEKLMAQFKPDVVYHLAAQAYPVISWKDPEMTFTVNVLGTIYLFESLRRENSAAQVVVACSGAEYGDRVTSPIREESVLRPLSPYGVSKATQDMLVYQYYRSYGMRLFSLRLFGTTGPGKTGDAVNDFARQIAIAERNGGEVKVGNLSAVRDISDVRDVIKAFTLVREAGQPGEAYNVGSGRQIEMRKVLEILIKLSKAEIVYHVDENLLRPADEQVIYPDTSKINALGYRPEFSIERTLSDVLEFWRARS